MTPEQKAREVVDQRLVQAGWILQDAKRLNLLAGLRGVLRKLLASTRPVNHALFADSIPVGVVEAKVDERGENITTVY